MAYRIRKLVFRNCGINIPLLLTLLLSCPGRLSSATAGVIPIDRRRSPAEGFPLKAETTSSAAHFSCPPGYYAIHDSKGSSERNTTSNTMKIMCKMCLACGCGMAMNIEDQALMTCTITSCSNFQSCATANMTMGACIAANGGGCLMASSALKLLSTTRYDSQLQNMTTTMSPEAGLEKGIPLVFIAVIVFFLIVTFIVLCMAAVVVYARRRGCFPTLWVRSLSCSRCTSPLKRTTRHKGARLDIRTGRLYQSTKAMDTANPDWEMEGSHLGEELGMLCMEESPLVPEGTPLVSEIAVETRDQEPYWLVMRGRFTSAGGTLHCEESDVVLEIPPGAIPTTIESQEIVAKVALVTTRFDFKMKKDEVCLSPVVEFLSPGLDQFDKNVIIKIPHRARLNFDWTFRVHFTQTHGQVEGAWQTVGMDGSCHRQSWNFGSESDVGFYVTNTHFVIKTPHFSKYVCTGCSKKRYLNLEAFICAKYIELPDRQQVELNCYVADTIKDCSHRIQENEAGRPRSERHPIHLKSKDPLEVTLLTDNMGEEWQWEAHTFRGAMPTTHAIPLRNIVRCCSDAVPYFVSFSLRAKAPSSAPESFEALVGFKQKGSEIDLKVPIAFNLGNVNSRESTLFSSPPPTPRLVSQAVLNRVAQELGMDKWRPLCRRLIPGKGVAESQISSLECSFGRNADELRYQMLLCWQQRRGKQATVQELCRCLRECGLVSLAEQVETMVETNGELP